MGSWDLVIAYIWAHNLVYSNPDWTYKGIQMLSRVTTLVISNHQVA